MDETTTIELAPLPRRWFRIAAIGCVALGLVMAVLLAASGGIAAAVFFVVFTLSLGALAHGIARSIVVLGPGATIAVTNGYRRHALSTGDVQRVDVVRVNERSAPRRVSLSLGGGTTIQLLATDGAGRSGDDVEALAERIRSFVAHAGGGAGPAA